MSEVRTYLKHWSKSEPSVAAIRVAELLEAWQGLHHLEDDQMRKADWTNWYVKLNMRRTAALATVDFNDLTRLVFLAHDHCIRVEIVPCNPQYLTLLFHPRQTRVGTLAARHPTLEAALEEHREKHQSLQINPPLPVDVIR